MESILLEKGAAKLAVLNRFRQLGISLALDEFGTGCSSPRGRLKTPIGEQFA
jgi:EAL domain-containing protein (putative c-di-GMP-specific phosphodiesterase class I)